MPPSGHSSSSRSSSSRSSSSRSSSSRSYSSSSRSSYSSSSRSPSSHSSSSRSSSAYSSRSSSSYSSKPAASRGPSQHAASSKNSGPALSRQPDHERGLDWRPRVNQPTGFVPATKLRPTYYYGRRHSYCYYPQDWVDADTGVSYRKGYYDENGQRYDSVTFEEGGRYKNVVCHCSYCERDTILDLSASEVGGQTLTCPSCGAPMEIVSELDAIMNEDSVPENTHEYNSAESLRAAAPKKKSRVWLILGLLVLVMGVKRTITNKLDNSGGGSQVQQISVVENGGGASYSQDALCLERQSDGSYSVVSDVVRADRILYYDESADSYYDESSDCWLWYNTYVEPAVWQYWYEGISSDFGDYGWMEHDDEGWWIEEDDGSWIALPDEYDADALWYIG